MSKLSMIGIPSACTDHTYMPNNDQPFGRASSARLPLRCATTARSPRSRAPLGVRR
jgi:hypothetical protein